MPRTIKVSTACGDHWDIIEVDLEKAQRILEDTYNDPSGGLVVDAKTMEVIWHIGHNNGEGIIVLPEMLH